MSRRDERRLGEILVANGVISRRELQVGLDRQEDDGRKIGRVLVALDAITDAQLAEALSTQLGLPPVKLSSYDLPEDVVDRFPERLARERRVLPLEDEGGCVRLAMANPFDVSTLDQARMVLGREVHPGVAPQGELKRSIRRAYGPAEPLDHLVDDISAPETGPQGPSRGSSPGRADPDADEAPVIRYVDRLLREAVEDGASDVHLEPFRRKLVVRRRIDGVLHELDPPPREYGSAIVSRIKVMADLDIARTRLPQDGRIELTLDERSVSFRVNTFPTVFGESVVLRVLHRGNRPPGTDQLGMRPGQEERFRRMLQGPDGILLVTGRTSSGKTTTLYSGLDFINEPGVKIVTLEDPVEYRLSGLIQTQVNEAAGYTFARGMRALLRHDPDVCLVGEIRDRKTAKTAAQAALTGHRVFSTVHTNRAAGAVNRLVNMGVEPFLLSSTLQAVLGQCLVRLVCDECREEYRPSPEDLRRLGVDPGHGKDRTFTRGAGCGRCGGTGYRSRTGLFELLELTPEIVRLVDRGVSSDVIHRRALEEGMLSVREHGWHRVIDGETTVEEVLRVVPGESGVSGSRGSYE